MLDVRARLAFSACMHDLQGDLGAWLRETPYGYRAVALDDRARTKQRGKLQVWFGLLRCGFCCWLGSVLEQGFAVKDRKRCGR